MTHETKLPDLPEMMAMGLGITEALAFWSRMMNDPRRDQIDWWAELRRITTLHIN